MTVDRTELRRLHAAATPGPWTMDGNYAWSADQNPVTDAPTIFESEDDAAFFVAAVNALPVLLDRLDTYREALTKIEKVPLSEKGDDANLVVYMRRTARAALDTEQT